MRLLRQLAPVHSVDEAVNPDEKLSLRIVGINSLRYRNEANAGERQPLIKIQCVGQLALRLNS